MITEDPKIYIDENVFTDDMLAAVSNGISMDTRCRACGRFYCLCFENERADELLFVATHRAMA